MPSQMEIAPDMLIAQSCSGYRFGEDSVQLAEFVGITSSQTLLDIGCGSAPIPLLIWHRQPFHYAVGVELDPELATLAWMNVSCNQLIGRVSIIQADVRNLSPFSIQGALGGPDGRFDVIVSNPPFWPLSQGRLNHNLQKASARHEISLTLKQLVSAGSRLIQPGGRLYLCHLQSREKEIDHELACAGFAICRTRILPGRNPRILIEAAAPSVF
jgi:tRNA1Val (adenine37-N6)-methyltransferase